MELQNGAQPNMDIRELQSTVNQNVLQPATTPENCSHNATTNNKQGNSMPESDFVSKVHEFSSSSNSDDLKEISNWSECEDAGSVLSPLSTPPNLPLPKQTRQSSRLKQTSTIGNTPFHPPSKSNPYVRVMVRNIQAPDISTSSVFSTTPDETSSAPAVLEYNKSQSNTVDLNESNLDNSDYANKRSREETSSDSSFSTTLEFRLVGKKKK
uniref:uncharacterized protein LOC120326512 n=1 Tax=Styela clava TaxID=7725 RepID=UPI001939FCDD|nr:uncharacterized protein LOC120326512 [Styela clava]